MTGRMKVLTVIWSFSAKADLKDIFNYYKVVRLTPQGAVKVKNDILKATNELIFATQYQKDTIQPEYRRIIVRHWKVIYKVRKEDILILRIFSTRQNPNKQIG